VTLEGPEGRKVILNVMNPYNLQWANPLSLLFQDYHHPKEEAR
jgi:hypothetical protein